MSLYLNDVNSGTARRRISGHRRPWLTPLHRAEWAHAVARAEFRGLISDHEARRLYSDFKADRERGLWAEAAMPEMSFETCARLAQQHGSRIGLTTLDTLHVASALELGAERFWTFDERQAKLARAVRLKA